MIASSTLPRWTAGLVILVSVALHLVQIWTAEPLRSANDRSRWATVWSVVERGTYQIDAIRQVRGWDTIDLIRVDGHFYSTKPPLLSTVVAGLYWVVKATTGLTLLGDTQRVAAILLTIVNGVPFALGLIALSGMLRVWCRSPWTHLFILVTAAFATLLTPFVATLNNHLPAAMTTVFALALFQRFWRREGLRPLTSLGIGFFAGLTVTLELPALLMLVTIGALVLWRRHFAAAGLIALGAALALSGHFVTNYAATGELIPAYSGYGTDRYQFVHEGVPSYWTSPSGVDRNLDSPPAYIFHCLLGHHGILSLTPVFLLGWWGWSAVRRREEADLKIVTWVGLWVTVVVLGFYFTRTQNYNFGGVSVALRWALWMVPFWLIAMIPTLDGWVAWSGRPRGFGHWVSSGLLALSIVFAWAPGNNPWQQPWLFQWMQASGWIDYRDPPPTLDRELWTWFPRVPDVEGGATVWTEWSNYGGTGSPRTMRMTVAAEPGSPLRRLTIRLAEGTRTVDERTFLVDPVALAGGQRPAAIVRWNDPATTPEKQQADLAFVRGLPMLKQYHAGPVRYLKTPVRRDAWKCQRAAAEVAVAHAPQPSTRHRSEVWLCDDIPFGVAQRVMTVTDEGTGEIVSLERWIVSGSSEPLADPAPAAPPAVTAAP